jgi:hypothetical protein
VAEPEWQNLQFFSALDTATAFSVTITHFRSHLLHHNCLTNISEKEEPIYADINALFNSRPTQTYKAVASAAALDEVDAVIVVVLADTPSGSEVSIIDDSCCTPIGVMATDLKIEQIPLKLFEPTQISFR